MSNEIGFKADLSKYFDSQSPADKMRIISATYHKLNDTDSIDDLRKLKLTLAEFDVCREIFPEISKIGGVAKTCLTGVADFFKNNGYSVELKNINYIITI